MDNNNRKEQITDTRIEIGANIDKLMSQVMEALTNDQKASAELVGKLMSINNELIAVHKQIFEAIDK